MYFELDDLVIAACCDGLTSEWVISKFNGTSTPKGSYSAKTGDNDCNVNEKIAPILVLRPMEVRGLSWGGGVICTYLYFWELAERYMHCVVVRPTQGQRFLSTEGYRFCLVLPIHYTVMESNYWTLYLQLLRRCARIRRTSTGDWQATFFGQLTYGAEVPSTPGPTCLIDEIVGPHKTSSQSPVEVRVIRTQRLSSCK